MRLLQIIQRQCGIARRKAQALIAEGRVAVNGEIITNPFLEVEPKDIEELLVDGEEVPLAPVELKVYKFYKPRGMLSSHRDLHHRNTLGRVLEKSGLKGYVVAGRLDQDAEGLMLISNDGELINLLTHPRYQVEKVYRVWVPRVLPFRHAREVLQKMQRGIVDGGEKLKAVRGRLIRRYTDSTEFELVLAEGKKQEIKRLFKHFRLPVARLVRVAIGPITLGGLKPGEIVRLTSKEHRLLKRFKAQRLELAQRGAERVK
jgi:23S rRNA pseudouridine2605 synthase